MISSTSISIIFIIPIRLVLLYISITCRDYIEFIMTDINVRTCNGDIGLHVCYALLIHKYTNIRNIQSNREERE